MIKSLSSADEALSDTLVSRAVGESFDQLCRWYGIPRFVAIDEAYWRKALLSVLFAPRGTISTTLAFLEALFDHWAVPSFTYTVSFDPNTPHTAARVDGPPGFYCAHVGRLVRVESPSLGSYLRWSTSSVTGALGGFAGGSLTFTPQGTAYWKGSGWGGLSASEQGTVKILPFIVRETSPCLVEVLVDQDLWSVPPTYMQESGQARPANQPLGGHIVDTTTAGDTVTGPHPPYLPGDEAFGELKKLLDLLLPAGCQALFKTHAFCSDFNIFDLNRIEGRPENFDWSLPIV